MTTLGQKCKLRPKLVLVCSTTMATRSALGHHFRGEASKFGVIIEGRLHGTGQAFEHRLKVRHGRRAIDQIFLAAIVDLAGMARQRSSCEPGTGDLAIDRVRRSTALHESDRQAIGIPRGRPLRQIANSIDMVGSRNFSLLPSCSR